jgi:hypothetical protein
LNSFGLPFELQFTSAIDPDVALEEEKKNLTKGSRMKW